MGSMVSVSQGGRTVKVDVTDEGATQARAYGRTAQREFVRNLMTTLGFEVEDDESGMPPSISITGKRGIANRGFTALVWPKVKVKS